MYSRELFPTWIAFGDSFPAHLSCLFNPPTFLRMREAVHTAAVLHAQDDFGYLPLLKEWPKFEIKHVYSCASQGPSTYTLNTDTTRK